MVDEFLSRCYDDISGFASKRNLPSPPWTWTVYNVGRILEGSTSLTELLQVLRTIRQYPSGLTRSVLLTEVDSKW